MKQKKLFTRDFTMVVAGQIISLFGNAALRLALPLYLLEVTGSSALFGLISGLAFLPMILLAPVGGVVADRLPKAKMMAGLDFFTCALTVALGALLDRAPLVPLLLAGLMLLYGIQGAYQPVVSASMPLLAGPEQLISANAVINLVSSLSGLLGPVLGGLLYARMGIAPVLWMSAVCFLSSAGMELLIRIPRHPVPLERSIGQTVRADLEESLHFLFQEQRVLAKGVGLICAFNLLLSAMLIVGLPVIITRHLGLGEDLYGLAEGAMGLGGLLGGGAAGVLGSRLTPGRSHLTLILCAGMTGGMALPLALDAPALVCYGVIVVLTMAIMVLATMFTVVMLSFVQGRTPEHLVGKVVSCVMALAMCASPLGQVLYGAMFQWLSPWVVVAFSALSSGVVALFAWRVFQGL